ncbi:MAG: cell division protein FtsZ [Flavobacteriales bacterium]
MCFFSYYPLYEPNKRIMEDKKFDMMRFDLPKEHSSIIKVIGVGGGGSNAVNYMFEQGIKGVDFIVCNTDAQALDASPVPIKIQLGETLTEGRGAGSIPEVGRNAAVENLDDVKNIIGTNTTMVFVTAGMGGGTGTGAAPVIARAAKEMGILTVGIVTVPFMFEGKRRSDQAAEGLAEMRDSVDTLLVITNDKLRELFGNLPLKKAFDHADEVLCTAAKGIAEVITLTGEINVDMNDVNTVMRNSGVAVMGSGRASGEGRAMVAVKEALESPLLNDNDIEGANFVLLNITYGDEEVLMDEISEITDYIQDCAGRSAEVIWGYGLDDSLGNDLCVTVIATGFKTNEVDGGLPLEKEEIKKVWLPDSNAKEVVSPVNRPTGSSNQVDVSPAPEPEPFLKKQEEEVRFNLLREVEDEKVSDEWEVIDNAQSQSELFVDEKQKPQEQESSEPELKSDLETESIKFEAKEVPEEDSKFNYFDLDGNEMDREDLLTSEPTDALSISEVEEEAKDAEEETLEDRPSREELQMRNREREQRIREISMKLKTPSGLVDLENEPAFRRRNIRLDDTPHSSDSSVSKFALGEEEDESGNKRAQLRDDNSFLHGQVD